MTVSPDAITEPAPDFQGGANWRAVLTLPVLVLTGIYFFDEFDTAAFNVLAPNIQKSFHISSHSLGLLIIGNLSLLLLLAIPLSHYADRLPRRTFAVILGLLAGVCTFFTGVFGSLLLLVLVRLGNGIGVSSNTTIHNSLIADYYPANRRGQAYSVHQAAVYVGGIIGPLVAGGIEAATGNWRWSFMVLLLPLILVSLAALRLPEPVRGATDDLDAAVAVSGEDPITLREAARTLMAVPTLKRQYTAYIFIGAGFVPLGFLLPFYLQKVYHVGAFGRGAVTSGNAAFSFAGIIVAGALTRRWFAKHPGEPLRFAGLALVLVGVGLTAVAAAPNLPTAIVIGFITSFFGGAYFPPFLQVQSVVSPARVRTLSFGFGALFLVAGVVGIWVIGLGIFKPSWNLSARGVQDYRLALGALLPWWVIGGAVLASAKKMVPADMDKALRTLGAAVELRRSLQTAGEHALLMCNGVDVAYDKVQVLFNVDFQIREGEIVALLGTNGAGKSTLLKAISGLVDPAGGAIYFDGRDVSHLDAVQSTKLGIIQMPGGRSVFPTLTVGECLRLAGWMYKRHDADYVKEATEQALVYFPVLRKRSDQLAGNLSGGEQQMLGLAMAFIAKPKLLMIDELSLGLAPTIVGQLADIVRAIHDRGTTIILVEQSVNVALTLAQRAVFMEKGEIRFEGPTSELLDRDDILRSVFLEGAAKGQATAQNKSSSNGRATARTSTRAASKELLEVLGAPELLTLNEVGVRFGGVQAVDGVSFELHKGEVLGLIGPNGAGKTTVFDAISGFVRGQRGRITFLGEDVTTMSPDGRARLGLGRSFQDARLFPSMTVVENIAVALERHIDVRDPLAAACGLPAVSDAESEVAYKVHELVELLGLGAFRNKFVSELSTGSRRIVDLAMAIAHQPSVLILDEPSSGIAQRETEALGPLLLRIKEEVGCALLVIEHDMPLITSISHRLVALELGRVVTTGTPNEVITHPAVVASYLGTDQAAIERSGTGGVLSKAQKRVKASAGV
jgi:ABC-type branched-subunit amino acid transport system ATPase component/predicted MFS family arabinose efflux permease